MAGSSGEGRVWGQEQSRAGLEPESLNSAPRSSFRCVTPAAPTECCPRRWNIAPGRQDPGRFLPWMQCGPPCWLKEGEFQGLIGPHAALLAVLCPLASWKGRGDGRTRLACVLVAGWTRSPGCPPGPLGPLSSLLLPSTHSSSLSLCSHKHTHTHTKGGVGRREERK